jgi:hypothetical protein
MTSEVIFNPTNLENLLIKHWTEFLDTRKLLNFLKINAEEVLHINNPKIQTLMVSNCELMPQGISLWINYNIVNSNGNVNITNQVLMRKDGTIENLNYI